MPTKIDFIGGNTKRCLTANITQSLFSRTHEVMSKQNVNAVDAKPSLMSSV